MYKPTAKQFATVTTPATVQQIIRRAAWHAMRTAAQHAATNRIAFQPFAY